MFAVLKVVSLFSLKAIGSPVIIPLWLLYQAGRLTKKAVKHPVKAARKIAAFPFTAAWWGAKGAYNLTVDALKDWRSFLLFPIGMATAARVAHNRRKSPDEPSILFSALVTGVPALLGGLVVVKYVTLKPVVMGLVSGLMADPRSFASLPMAQQAVIAVAASQILSVLFELSRLCCRNMFGGKTESIPAAIEVKPTFVRREPYDYLTMFNWITDRVQLTEIEAKQGTVWIASLLANGAITEKDSEDLKKRIKDRLPTEVVFG